MRGALEQIGLPLMRCLDPEQAHGLAIKAMDLGLTPSPGPITSPALSTELAGLKLPNPLGLAAGFDKNAEVIDPLLRAGFGFVEVGAVTPRPQPGNPRPRLFRLTGHHAAINRFGFNNDGVHAVAERLAAPRSPGIVGINLGANKDSEDRAADYTAVLTATGPYVDFATINVSSPNTAALRDLQGAEALTSLIARVMTAREGLSRRIPVFVKIAPDLSLSEVDDIARVSVESGISGLIATNTTVARDMVSGPHADEAGGLSGKPLFEPSTEILRHLAGTLSGELPIIGVGGIDSAETAREKLSAGATALQLYTGLVFHGLGLVSRILAELAKDHVSAPGQAAARSNAG